MPQNKMELKLKTVALTTMFNENNIYGLLIKLYEIKNKDKQ